MQNDFIDEEIKIVVHSQKAMSKETLTTNQTTTFTKKCIVILIACLCVFGAKLFVFNDQPLIVTNPNERQLQANDEKLAVKAIKGLETPDVDRTLRVRRELLREGLEHAAIGQQFESEATHRYWIMLLEEEQTRRDAELATNKKFGTFVYYDLPRLDRCFEQLVSNGCRDPDVLQRLTELTRTTRLLVEGKSSTTSMIVLGK